MMRRNRSELHATRASNWLSSRSVLGWGTCSALLMLASACSKPQSASVETASEPSTAAVEAKSADAPVVAAPAAAPAEAAGPAKVGAVAPDFTLSDLNGKSVSLSEFRGKTVVLEWFNPGCPFVKNSHTTGSLKGLADKHASEGVVWLAVNSGAAGKEGAGLEANRAGVEKFGIHYPVLIDDAGKVGKLYGAERTPHMYVINPAGVLVYKGAIDNSPDAEGQSPEGGKLINYVDGALGAIKTGAKVSPEETKAYGCGVKYQS